MINKTALLKIALSTFVTFSAFTLIYKQASAATVTLNPTGDSMVGSRTDIENNTFGTWDLLEIGYDTSNNPPWAFFGILKFDTSSIPSNATINKATFRFYLQKASQSTGQMPSYKVARAKSSWSEKSITWQNKPEMDSASSTATFSNTAGYKEWDVKSLVTQWINGTYSNYGFYVASSTRAEWVSTFYSREGAQKPQLVVEYTVPVETKIIPLPVVPVIKVPVIIENPVVIIDVFPPTITNVKVTNSGVSTAKVTWTTNENSTSYVDYGDTTTYTRHKGQSDSVKTHEVSLDGLVPLKTYHFMVRSADSKGNEGKTDDAKFMHIFKFTPMPGVGTTVAPEIPAEQSTEETGTGTEVESTGGVGLEVDATEQNSLDETNGTNETADNTAPGTTDTTTTKEKGTDGTKQEKTFAEESLAPMAAVVTSVLGENGIYTLIGVVATLMLVLIVALVIIQISKREKQPQTPTVAEVPTKELPTEVEEATEEEAKDTKDTEDTSDKVEKKPKKKSK